MQNTFKFLEVTGGNGAATEPFGGLFSLLPMLAIMAFVFYFLLYRPQKKQQRNIAAMHAGLNVGDEISTSGGIIGKIVQIKEDFLVIETGSDRTKMKIAKWAVRSVEVAADADDDDDDEDDDE